MRARSRVLLVEDSPTDAELVIQSLAETGVSATPTVVGSAGEALRALAEGTFDCAVVDLNLPDSHGVATVQALTSRAPGLPVVVLTGHGDEALGAAALSGGAHEFLTKAEASTDRLRQAMTFAMQRARLLDGRRDPAAQDLELLLHSLSDLVAQTRSRPQETMPEALQEIANLVAHCQSMQQAGLTPGGGVVAMDQVVDRALVLLAADLTQTEVEVERPGRPLPTVRAEDSAMREVMLHLLRNAITDAGPAGRVWVAGRIDGTIATLEVGHGGVVKRSGGRAGRLLETLPTTGALGSTASLDFCAGMIVSFGGTLWSTTDADGRPVVRFRLPTEV